MRTAGDIAYVTDAQAKAISLVQISTGTVLSTLPLDVVPNEMAVVDAEESLHH